MNQLSWNDIVTEGLAPMVERIFEDFLLSPHGPRAVHKGECMKVIEDYGLQSTEMLKKVVELQRDRFVKPGLFTALMALETQLKELVAMKDQPGSIEEEAEAEVELRIEAQDSATEPLPADRPWAGVARSRKRKSRKLPLYPVYPEEAFVESMGYKTDRFVKVAAIVYGTFRTPNEHREALEDAGHEGKWYDHFLKRIVRHGESYGWKMEADAFSATRVRFVLDEWIAI